MREVKVVKNDVEFKFSTVIENSEVVTKCIYLNKSENGYIRNGMFKFFGQAKIGSAKIEALKLDDSIINDIKANVEEVKLELHSIEENEINNVTFKTIAVDEEFQNSRMLKTGYNKETIKKLQASGIIVGSHNMINSKLPKEFTYEEALEILNVKEDNKEDERKETIENAKIEARTTRKNVVISTRKEMNEDTMTVDTVIEYVTPKGSIHSKTISDS